MPEFSEHVLWIMFLSKNLKLFVFDVFDVFCSSLVFNIFFLQNETDTMNGNSRTESDTESSSSLASQDLLADYLLQRFWKSAAW